MKTKKFLFIILLTFIILLVNIGIVNASSFSAKLTSTTTNVKRGDEITIGLVVSNIDLGQGLFALSGQIKWDKNALTYSTVTSSNGWGTPTFANENATNPGKFAVENSAYVKQEQQVLKATFKVKDTAPIGETTISLIDVLGTDGNEEISTANSSIKINIQEKANSGDNSQNNNNNGNTNNQQNNDNNGSGTTNGSDTSGKSGSISKTGTTTKSSNSGTTISKANGTLPKTGIENYIIIGAVLLVLSIVIIISYKKYKDYRGI